MTVTVAGESIHITVGTLFFFATAIVAGVLVYQKMAPPAPTPPGAAIHSVGERLLAACTATAAIIAVGQFVTGGITARTADSSTPRPAISQSPQPTGADAHSR